MQSELVLWLGRLRELSALAGAGLPIDEALTLVATTARELLGFDFCGVLVPDEEQTALVITGWSGLSRSYVDGVNSTSPVTLDGTAPSSRAYHSGRPVAVADIELERGFEPWGGVALQQGYRSMVSVPLRAAGQVLGTLNGYHTVTHEYSGDEIERLTLLATYAAAALNSAALVEELRRLNDSLVTQRDLLTRSEAIHQRLLRVSLDSGGLEGVVRTLAELTGLAVVLDDARGATLAAAGDPRGLELLRGGDAEAGARGVGAADAGTEVAARPVLLGSEEVGRLRLGGAPSAHPLDPIDGRAVDHAAVVIALEMLRLRTALETEYRIQGELLADVLLFGVSKQAVRRAAALGHDLGELRLAVVAEVPGAGTGAPPDRRRVLAALSAVSAVTIDPGGDSAAPVAPLVAEHQGRVVALWPLPAGAGAADTAGAVHRALREAFPGDEVLVASSGELRRSIGDAHRVATGVLGIARSSGRREGAVDPGDLGILGVLLQVDQPEALLAYARALLGGVIDYDARRGTELVATVRVFLRSGGDRSVAADLLRVHPNTVNQRLRRIETLTGRPLRTAPDQLEYASALAVWEIAGGR
jgi:GAF domain-containing protein/sugar diacid utilization regulator